MRNQSLGVNINQTLVLKGAASVTDSVYQNVYQPFKTDLLKIPGIKNVTASTNVMGEEIYWTNGSHQLTPNAKSVTLYNLGIDHDFIPSYRLKMIAGRNFSKDFKSDEHAVLLNEEAARLLGFTDFNKAVNQSFFSAGDTIQLAGIVADYHHEGLQKTIPPMIFRLRPNSRGSYGLRSELIMCSQPLLLFKKPGVNIFLLIHSLIFSLMNILISNTLPTSFLEKCLGFSLFLPS
jgi:putative ABC transport system permease protein